MTLTQNEIAVSQASGAGKQSVKRVYSVKTIKVLFGLCGNRCAAPDCSNPIISPSTELSDDAVVGQICHIYAASDNGPRGKPGLTEAEKNSPDNLILCCSAHHSLVDKQHNDYPASMLLDWKRSQERAYRNRISASIKSIGYSELEVAAKALMSHEASASSNSTVIPPKEKIQKNGLSSAVGFLLQLGAAKSREVEEVLLKGAQLDASFPDRLREGFVVQYEALKQDGYKGDDLFYLLYSWAGGGGQLQSREVAGLCILSHLFVICDVFEK